MQLEDAVGPLVQPDQIDRDVSKPQEGVHGGIVGSKVQVTPKHLHVARGPKPVQEQVESVGAVVSDTLGIVDDDFLDRPQLSPLQRRLDTPHESVPTALVIDREDDAASLVLDYEGLRRVGLGSQRLLTPDRLEPAGGQAEVEDRQMWFVRRADADDVRRSEK